MPHYFFIKIKSKRKPWFMSGHSFPSTVPFTVPLILPSIHHLSNHPMCFLADSLGTPASDEDPCQISVQNPTSPPITTKLRPRPRPRPKPVTQPIPTSADRLSSPGFTVTPTNVTHVTRYGFQVSGTLDRTPSPLIPSPCA